MTASRVPPPAPDVWVRADVVVDDSSIDGRGLFAGRDLDAGTVVLRLGGRLVTTAELGALLSPDAAADDGDGGGGSAFVDTVTIAADRHLVLPPGSPAHHGNHSCDPTTWFVGPYELATRRPVAAGDELTLDYGTCSGLPGFEMACRCGTPVCRGRVTSEDWRRSDLRQRYGRHWTPALWDRIAAEGGE